MSFTSSIKHNQVYFTGNPIKINIPAGAASATPRSKYIYRVKVFIEEFQGSSKFIEIGVRQKHEKAPYVRNGVTYLDGASIDIADILDAYISIVPPEANQGTILSVPHAWRFYTESDIPTLVTTPVVSTINVAIPGRLSKRQFALWKDSFFTTRMDTEFNWLTWAPANKKTTKTSPEYLYFIDNFNPKPANLYVYLSVKTTDGANYYSSIGSSTYIGYTIQSQGVMCLPVSFVALGLDVLSVTPGTWITGWEVWVGTVAYPPGGFPYDWLFNDILAHRTYTLIDPNNTLPSHFVPTTLVFQNSLGGYDTLVFAGQRNDTAATVASKVAKVVDGYSLPTTGEQEIVSVDGIHEISLNTGYFDFDQNYLLELMYSRDIRLHTQEGLIPIELITESVVFQDPKEFVKQRSFNFRFINTEIAGSFLGTAPIVGLRPTTWAGIEPYCTVNDFGIYSGYMKFASLQLIYADGANEPVPGAQPKPNVEGTTGYIAPAASAQCLAAFTPITNTIFVMKGTYKKNTCTPPQVGDYPTITINAGTYGGPDLATANKRAETAAKLLDTQAYANTGAGAAACITGPWAYSMGGIPTNFYNLRWGQRVAGNLTGIAAGAGMNSSNPADVIYGNTWYCFGSTHVNSIYISNLLFDNLLPIAPGTDYRLDVYTTVAKTVTVYKNGVSVFTNSVTLGDVAGTGYKRIPLTGLTYATGDKYYIDIV